MTGPHLTPEREAEIRAAVHAARLEAMHMPHGNGDLELLRGHLAEAERLLEELAPATAWGSSAAQRVGERAGVPAGASDLSAALDVERAAHAQTRAALQASTVQYERAAEDLKTLLRAVSCEHTRTDSDRADRLWEYVEHEGETWHRCRSCGLLELWAGGQFMRATLGLARPATENTP